MQNQYVGFTGVYGLQHQYIRFTWIYVLIWELMNSSHCYNSNILPALEVSSLWASLHSPPLTILASYKYPSFSSQYCLMYCNDCSECMHNFHCKGGECWILWMTLIQYASSHEFTRYNEKCMHELHLCTVKPCTVGVPRTINCDSF